MLHTIKLKQGIIEAVRYNVWMPIKKVDNFDFKEVATIAIESKFQDYERPYFNIDSCRIIAKQKNDSLRRTYTNRKEFVIYCIKSNKTKGDTLRLIENVCYNLTFANGLRAIVRTTSSTTATTSRRTRCELRASRSAPGGPSAGG